MPRCLYLVCCTICLPLTLTLGPSMVLRRILISGQSLSGMIPGRGNISLGEPKVSRGTWTLMNGSYFTKFERYQPHANYPMVDSSLRGSTGPVRIGYFNTETDKAKDFIKACINVGIPFTPDFHGPSGTMGVSRVSHVFWSVSLSSEYQICQNRSVSVWPRLPRKPRE